MSLDIHKILVVFYCYAIYHPDSPLVSLDLRAPSSRSLVEHRSRTAKTSEPFASCIHRPNPIVFLSRSHALVVLVSPRSRPFYVILPHSLSPFYIVPKAYEHQETTSHLYYTSETYSDARNLLRMYYFYLRTSRRTSVTDRPPRNLPLTCVVPSLDIL